MDEYESLSHTTWDCKYHVVFIPKCRRKTLYQELRRHLGEVFRRLALQKESKVEEGHLMPDHVRCPWETARQTPHPVRAGVQLLGGWLTCS
jgi:REP element-mobilizing transposase RayT